MEIEAPDVAYRHVQQEVSWLFSKPAVRDLGLYDPTGAYDHLEEPRVAVTSVEPLVDIAVAARALPSEARSDSTP